MQIMVWNEYTLGVCYYPEHWPENTWASDLERMLKNGITTVRVFEFGWSLVEPEEGVFVFDMCDRFLDLCREKGMHVILGTPTATPPAWLTETYPEVLNTQMDGMPFYHGGRRNYTYASPLYREKCARIVMEEARHFGQHPAVIGWQIDNELNCERCEFYSEADTQAFRAFLKDKYGNLDALNAAWGTVFWSQTYTRWDQVFVPRVNAVSAVNPSLELDYIRYVSAQCRSFCQMQSRILRRYSPGRFITTNGMFANVDNAAMTRESLDVYTYDSYPNFANGVDTVYDPDALADRKWSMHLSMVRGLNGRFGIMEQQSGANGWYNRMEAAMPRPGQLRLWAMQSVAHGADFVSFFRWHTATMGTEIYWHGILDYDGRDNRRLREVNGFARDLKAIGETFGAGFRHQVALLRTWDNEFDMGIDRWHGRVEKESREGIFRACTFAHVNMDYVELDYVTAEELARYPVAILPHAVIAAPETVEKLEAYVRQGGILMLGCRSGYKDTTGKCVTMPMPGLFSALTGTHVQEYSFLQPGEDFPRFELDGECLKAGSFVESLETGDAQVLARYADGWLAGEPLLTEHVLGKGRVWHLGGLFTEEITGALLRRAGVHGPDWLKVPAGVECVLREKDGCEYAFLLNYGKQGVTVEADAAEALLEGGCELSAYGVQVLRHRG